MVEGTDRLEIGDVVEVSGRVAPFMLEPGIKAAHIRVIGHCELAPPPERRVADLMSGRFNNRRSNVKGVLRSVKGGDFGKGGVTELVIGTADGPITANLRGEWPDLHRYRDAEISVDGVCVPSYNARAEFLRPEIEAFSIDAIHLVPFLFLSHRWRESPWWRETHIRIYPSGIPVRAVRVACSCRPQYVFFSRAPV